MTRARLKQQPLARTIVTKFDTVVADIHLRKKALSGSIAKKIELDTDFQSGDSTCGPGQPFVIDNIKTAVIIHGFRSFLLTIRYQDGSVVNMPCSGLFVFYGALDSVEVNSEEPLRFSYIRS